MTSQHWDILSSATSDRNAIAIMQRVFILRHGQRLDHVDKEWPRTASRPFDPPLTQEGKSMAVQAVGVLSNCDIKHVLSSPYFRCLQTATPIAESLNCPIKVETGIREFEVHYYKEHPDGTSPETLDEGGRKAEGFNIDETYTPVMTPPPEADLHEHLARCFEAVHKIADRFWPDNILLVSHAATTIAMAASLSKETVDSVDLMALKGCPYCGIFEISIEGEPGTASTRNRKLVQEASSDHLEQTLHAWSFRDMRT